MKKNKWRELYDSYSEEFRATLSWDEFMTMPETVRINLIPLTYEQIKEEYPDLNEPGLENADCDDATFELDCKIENYEISALKAVYDSFPDWFKNDFMSLGDFLS